MKEIESFDIITHKGKTIERFRRPGKYSKKMIGIFEFHFENIETDPKTFVFQSENDRQTYFTAQDLARRRQAARENPSISVTLFSEVKRALNKAAYALIIYEPLPSKKPSLFSLDARRRLDEAR